MHCGIKPQQTQDIVKFTWLIPKWTRECYWTITLPLLLMCEIWLPARKPRDTFLTWFQNLKRVAEVWMDEYAEYVYQRRPEYRHLSAGDMTVQKELRTRLNCKSFKWFMNEVAWDLPKHYPPVEPPAAAWGEVRSGESRLMGRWLHIDLRQ